MMKTKTDDDVCSSVESAEPYMLGPVVSVKGRSVLALAKAADGEGEHTRSGSCPPKGLLNVTRGIAEQCCRG